MQCTAATLANGASATAVVHVRVLAAAALGAVTNTATVVTDSTDPNTANNSDPASITVTGAGSQAPVPAGTNRWRRHHGHAASYRQWLAHRPH